MEKAYLVLSNGRIFQGESFGAEGESVGELVFTTNVVGYLETLTDPNYAGQIVIQTFPLIGNYGVIEEDFESECAVSGYVVRECCGAPSNFRCEYDLDTYLKAKGVCGICGVDTRELTRIIREEGAMSAKICREIPADLAELENYAVKDAVSKVSRQEVSEYEADGEQKAHVTLVDYGVKNSVIRALCQRGCKVTVVPYNTTAEDVIATGCDGVMLSDGPGDPRENLLCIEQIRKIIGTVPVLGIGLGHQMAAIAMGGSVTKLKYGHRGGNQPVNDLSNGRTYITSQNHGYVVDGDSLAGVGKVIFKNANDNTCEGVEYPGKDCITAQFTPEDGASACSTAFLYDRFIDMLGGKTNA